MQTGTDLTKSSIFALLQQGMKDRHAHSIAVLVSLFPELFDVFEQYAKDELESTDKLEVRERIGHVTSYSGGTVAWVDDAVVEIGQELFDGPSSGDNPKYKMFGYVREIRPGEFKFSRTCSWGPGVWSRVFVKDESSSKIFKEEVRECFDAATEILALRAQVKNQQQVIKDCAEVIEMFIDRVEVLDASCSCFISPPCNDCVEHGGLREALQVGKDIYKLIK